MKDRTSVRRIELSTQFVDGDGNEIISIEKIKTVLEEHKKAIKNYVYIIHDCDTKTVVSEDGTETIEPVKPHIHLGIRFKDNQPQHLEDVAKWFDVSESCLEFIKGSWNDYLLYLVHANAPDKFQYSPNSVVANFDYETALEKAKSKLKVDTIIEKILSGEICEYNKTREIQNSFLVNPQTARKIDLAFKVRAEHLQATQKERNTEVIYIFGTSGCGKTTFARYIADKLGLEYYLSSSNKDLFCSYKGEPVVILDEYRGENSSLQLNEVLRMLDNNAVASVHSRYRDKFLNCSLIIITNIFDLKTFFENLSQFNTFDEPFIQVQRRIKTYIHMDNNVISIRRWNDIEMKYSKPNNYNNFIFADMAVKKIIDNRTPKEQIEQLLPFLSGKELTKTKPPKTSKSEKSEKPKEIIDDEIFGKMIKMTDI